MVHGCVEAEGEDSGCWPYYGEEVRGPEDGRRVFILPCPCFDGIAVNPVDEDKAWMEVSVMMVIVRARVG